MKKNNILALFGAVVLAGQIAFVSAAGSPGSSSDPVVTESYVKAQINAINTNVDTSALETRISELEMKVSSLEKAVLQLQNNPSTPSTGGTVNSADLNLLYHLNGLNIDRKYGATATSGVAVKQSPSDSSKTLVTLNYYAGINLLDASNGWIKISYYDTVGWVKYSDVLPIMKTS